jgi:Mrp family chromosome partitioning ATPase
MGLVFRRYRYSDDLENASTAPDLVGVVPDVRTREPETDPAWRRAIHRIRVELQLSGATRRRGQIVALTGAGAAHGSSTISIGLAESFEEARMKTVLVDADLVDNGITARLQLAQQPGLREALVGGASPTQAVHGARGNLDVLPSGTSLAVTDERVSREPLQEILQRLQEDHDLVLVDIGPLRDRMTARLVAAVSDRVLYVVDAGTAASAVDVDFAELHRLAPRRAGVVLNRASRHDPWLAFQEPFKAAQEQRP